MSIWEAGYGEQPEDEMEQAWETPEPFPAADPDDWKDGEEWPEEWCGPEYWLNKKREGDDHGPST